MESAVAQGLSPPTITLPVSDAGGHFRLLKFGVHPNAKYELEKEFGELLIPTIPRLKILYVILTLS